MGKYINGKPNTNNRISETGAKELGQKRHTEKMDKLKKKYEVDSKYYNDILMALVSDTIKAGLPHKTDEVKLAEIFNAANKEWVKLVQKVNRSNKVIRLGVNQFRHQISLIAFSADMKNKHPEAADVSNDIPELNNEQKEDK